MIFRSKVLHIGNQAFSFFEEDKLIIMYGTSADQHLREYSVVIEMEELHGSLQDGMTLCFEDQKFTIVNVGHKVNETLKELSHVTLRFGEEAELLPGSIQLKEIPKTLPKVGSTILVM